MFAGFPTAVHPDAAVIALQFQGRVHGYHTDDLVCTLQLDDNTSLKALVQIKLTLKAIPSDAPFSDAIVAAWYDYQDQTHFERGRDRLVVAYSRDADGSGVFAASQITEFARTSLNSTEFLTKATAKGFSSKSQRDAFDSIKTVLSIELGVEPTADEVHGFLRHLWFLRYDVSSDESSEVATILGTIRLILGSELGGSPRGIWALLTAVCQKLNKEAGSISFANLDAQVSPRIAEAFSRHRSSPLAKLSVEGLSRPAFSDPATSLSSIQASADDLRSFSSAPVRSLGSLVEEIGLSPGRSDSANRVITGQLDAINEKLKRLRYGDALEDVKALGKDLGPFDAHQKARWFLQRGVCTWHLGDGISAADDFLRAAALFPNDDRMAAAGVRALLLRERITEALESGKAALDRFPDSLYVWLAYANALILSGKAIALSDIPASHRRSADALQLLAASYNQAGDRDEAVAVSLQSIGCADAGFYTRLAALSTVLQVATSNNVHATFRLINASTKAALRETIAAFEPRATRLWPIQAPESVAIAATNLALAHLLQGDADAALALVHEADVHGVMPPELLRIELEALEQSGNTQQLFARGRSLLPKLGAGALVGLAQAAANVGDVELTNQALEAARALPAADDALKDALRAIRWQAMWNAKDRGAVTAEVRAVDFASATSLPLIAVGVRVLRRSDPEIAAPALAKAEQIEAGQATPQNTLLLADMLFDAKEYAKAIPLYEKVLPPSQHSELHARLLYCYMRSGNRRKAKALIEGFPEGWVRDDNTRALAVELAQDVGDWSLLKVLADEQFAKEPNEVSSWLFKFSVAARDLPAAEIRQWLSGAPLYLVGNIQQTTQLAVQELRYGLREKGMQRLYRLRRLKASDVESASALLISFVSIAEPLPNMEEAVEAIGPGTHFTLVDGVDRIDVTLDPAEVGDLPEDEEFHNAAVPAVAGFIGKKVGDEVAVLGSFRAQRLLRVEHISSAYRRLLEKARLQMDRSLGPVPHITSISLGTSPNGDPDFTALHEQLKKQSDHVKEAFRTYRSMPITLGGFGRLIGRSSIDVVRGWPTSPDAAPLFVTGGTVEERQSALAQLGDPSTHFVIDAATIAELSALDATDALKSLPKVYATSETRDKLRRRLEEAEIEQASGTLFDDDGRMRLIEYTAEDRARAKRAAEAMVTALESLCEVVPSYGPEEDSELLAQLEKAVSDEEHAVLRLAAERNLCVVTVDGRLRNVAALLKLQGVWPQVLLMHATEKGQFTQPAYSLATAKMFLSNRSFVSLGPQDLLMMCHQGTRWTRFGIARYKQYLADERTEFTSAFKTSLEFVHAVAFSCTHMGAVAEVLRHVVEGLARHKACPDSFLLDLEAFVSDLLGPGSIYPYPPLKKAEEAKRQARLRFLLAAVTEGRDWAREDIQDRPVRIDVYVVGIVPWMVSSKLAKDEYGSGRQDEGNVPEHAGSPSAMAVMAARP
jgi:tetratricopeptide (TPR) repeat protein